MELIKSEKEYVEDETKTFIDSNTQKDEYVIFM